MTGTQRNQSEAPATEDWDLFVEGGLFFLSISAFLIPPGALGTEAERRTRVTPWAA